MPTSTSVKTSSGRATPEPGRTDLWRAWTATGVMVVGLVAMGVIMTRLDLDLSYGVSAAIRGVGVGVVVLLAAAAVRFGTRARRQSHASGMVAAVLAGTIAGCVALMAIISTIAHLVGFE